MAIVDPCGSEKNAPPPKVSILMITYNHERFIAQALESVLAQRTDFPYEVVVGEDCSTDHTLGVALECQHRHPDRIRVLAREKNLGMLRNLVATYQACRGKYIAFLEGDDYWTDPAKMQMQVDFLESHSEFSICFHNALEVEDESGEALGASCRHIRETSTVEDLAYALYIPTCSALIRKAAIRTFPDWFFEMPMGDWPILLLAAQRGKIRFMDKVMAHHRCHAGGVWQGSGKMRNAENLLRAVQTLNAALGYRYDRIFKCQQFWCWCDLAVKHEQYGQRREARDYRAQARRHLFRHFPLLLKVGWEPKLPKLNIIFRLLFPRTWTLCRSLRNAVLHRKPVSRSLGARRTF
jgi:glycosyltransferase involved in cell wall biosynthesis